LDLHKNLTENKEFSTIVSTRGLPRSLRCIKSTYWGSIQWTPEPSAGIQVVGTGKGKEGMRGERKRGGKKRKMKSIYIVPFIICIVSKRSNMDHIILPANYTMPAFPS